MQSTRKKPLQIKNVCALIFCLSIVILGAVCCGMMSRTGIGGPPFSVSSGQCKGNDVAPVAGEQTLAVVTQNGPNITICILRASDGILLRHYDLALHGTILGSGDGLLYMNEGSALCAIHISDGLERWCQPQQNPTSIIVSNGNAYVTSRFSGTSNVSGTDQTLIAALNERDGRVLWTSSVVAATGSANALLLTAGPGTLYSYQAISTALPTPTTSTNQTFVSWANNVCALRASDGQQLWCYPLTEPSVTGMVVDGNSLYVRAVGDYSSLLYALDTASGAVRWHAPIDQGDPTNTPPLLTITNGILFTNIAHPYASSDELYAIRASDGKQLWSAPQPGLITSVAATKKSVYAVTKSGDLYVLNILNGTPAWSYESPLMSTQTTDENKYVNDITIGQNIAYILMSANTYGYLIAINANDGATVWQDQGCDPSGATPTASPGTASGKQTTDRCYWAANDMNQGQWITPLSLFQVDN